MAKPSGSLSSDGERRSVGARPGLVTMADVARHAKLSRATVSKIFNKTGYVRPETVARVQEVVQRLGYRPNEMARSLVRQSSRLIAVVFSWNADPWAAEIMESMSSLAREQGYHLVVYPGPDMNGDASSSLDSLMSWRADAVITFVALGDKTMSRLISQGPAVVAWGFPDFELPRLHFVCVDVEIGMSRIMTYLTRLGHRRIAYLGYRDQLTDAVENRMSNAHPDVEVSVHVPMSPTSQSGAEAVAPLLAAPGRRPTAIICRTDSLAFGVLSGLDRAGLRVPEDVSVVGINDVHIAGFTKPPLTTLRISSTLVARRMVDTAVAVLRGEEMPKYQPISPELIVRESVCPAR